MRRSLVTVRETLRLNMIDSNLRKIPFEEWPAPREFYCLEVGPENFACLRERGHKGDHIAHGLLAEVVRRWK